VPLKLLDDLGVDYAVHGDDLPKVGGGGLFDEVMRAGRLRIVKRTEGTSTTELIGRLFSMSREHHIKSAGSTDTGCQVAQNPAKPMLLPTISRMVDFRNDYSSKNGYPAGEANGKPAGGGVAGRRVVYVPGIWDLFHIGHVRFLQEARKLGDFVLVGALGDEIVNKMLGRNFPLQTVHERSLALLACRYVDDVILGAPWKISQDLITTMNISVVCHGSTDFWDSKGVDLGDQGDPFEIPRSLNMLVQRDTGCKMTVHLLAHRIWQHAEAYAIRQQKKESEEKKYVNGKEFVAEA
jgi:ethanolamine-phosphate cytidylyltransferase